MDSHEGSAARPDWTLADVLSSPRYWAFFLSVLLAAAAIRSFFAGILPFQATQMGAGYATISLFAAGSVLGSVAGGMIAILVAPHRPKLAIMLPVFFFAAAVVGLLPVPALWISGPYLILMGLCAGAFGMVSFVAMAGVLVSGRLSRADFIQAFALPLLFVLIVPDLTVAAVAAALTATSEGGPDIAVYGLLACLTLALVIFALAREFAFDDAPPRRHVPLGFRRRSPLVIALIAVIPGLSFGLFAVVRITRDMVFSAEISFTALIWIYAVTFLAGLVSALYCLYWIYRIHGEVAGQSPSQRLLSPFAATVISLFVPLGYPLVLVTIGNVLRERTMADPSAKPLSWRWLAFWIVALPPVAMAMIQSAANRLDDAE